ncbi:MAG: NAD(+)/NADH kinase [Fusobacteriaceae bacterium]|jgi:NAD+ kinase|nr:NAD(+)/NADH kinase [Fusobacteriaceae bacterium]
MKKEIMKKEIIKREIIKRVVIIYNKEKKLAQTIYCDSLKYFLDKNIEVIPISEIATANFVVVIGGDGTLLRGFREIIGNENLFVIAINAGNLGFLTEIKHEKMFEIYDDFISENFKWEERHILEIDCNGKKHYALNEVLISKEYAISKIIRTKFSSDGEYMCVYKGDGVIVSTPAGSTAYSMSAGGPIVKSNTKVIIITPFAPHNLNTRPIVIHGDEKIDIEIIDENRKGIILIDGQISETINNSEIIKIKYYEKTLKMIIPRDRNYYSILREKLKWGDNLC